MVSIAAYVPSFFQYQDIEGKSKLSHVGDAQIYLFPSSNKQFERYVRCPLLAHTQAWVSLDSLLLSPYDRDEDFANNGSADHEYNHDLETEPTEAQKKICKVIKIHNETKRYTK